MSGLFSWHDGEKTLVFEPDEDLGENTEYIVTITTNAVDLAGNALESGSVTSFTTTEDECEGCFTADLAWYVVPIVLVLVAIVLVAVWYKRRQPPLEDEAPSEEEPPEVVESNEV
jgi:hypothetical protein